MLQIQASILAPSLDPTHPHTASHKYTHSVRFVKFLPRASPHQCGFITARARKPAAIMGQHYSDSDDEDYAYCDKCEREFSSKASLRRHFKRFSKHHFCVDCDRDFRSHERLRAHWVRSSKHHFCTLCDTDLPYDDVLEEHQRDEHYWCGQCDEVLGDEDARRQHWNSCHWYCEPCHKFCRSEHNLLKVRHYIFQSIETPD